MNIAILLCGCWYEFNPEVFTAHDMPQPIPNSPEYCQRCHKGTAIKRIIPST